jgi:hypothetical protein
MLKSKTINLSHNDDDEQEQQSEDHMSSRSGTTGLAKGRPKRRTDEKVVPRIEETMSNFMHFKREQATVKAQNISQGQEFSIIRCLAVLKPMVDVPDDVTEPPNYDGPQVPVIAIVTSDSHTYVYHNLKGLLSSEQDPITGVLNITTVYSKYSTE